ncbi:type II toxin-antitoxin system RelE/ParE family toxin [Gluconobacter oxydans]|uniref:Toxin n=1 Tax=Gluconobacter oxydans TaxID=442 RepID=A0A149S7D6_GLUOY|nr:type II toxin-antitoxin system RelE/ParE family toxin [Gluconobacter oxydans]KXV22615.1 hypothetical protein AD934_01205 [Gluconobacter oxydans]
MKQLVFSPAAKNDLLNIWDYGADNFGEDAADRYHDEIMDIMERVAAGVYQGRDASHIRAGYLKYNLRREVAFYRESDDRIEVIRILGGAMDHARHL